MTSGYIPALTAGQPGRAVLPPGSSMGLLRHLKAHADQDRLAGWAGLRGFCAGSRLGQDEAAALDGEIAAAAELGRPEIQASYQARQDGARSAPPACADPAVGAGFFDEDPGFDARGSQELAELVADPPAALGDRARALAALARRAGGPDSGPVMGFLESAARNDALRGTPVLDCVSLGWVALAAGLYAARGRPEAVRFAAALDRWPAAEREDLRWFLESHPGLL